jgi:hypothetical protein
MELDLPRTSEGVCPIVIVFLGRRGTGKTKLMEALAPLVAPREKLLIVSPIVTLKRRMPYLPWYEIHVSNKAHIEKLFRGWLNDGVQRFVLADEADELTAANAAGTAGGFVAQGVYDYINYGREQGLGIALSSRRPSNIAKDITSNANLVFVGPTVDPYALDYYSSWMQDPTDPDRDYRATCRLLKDHVFMVWSPIGDQKFLGYVTVDMATMEIRECSEKEALGAERAGDASDTDQPTTTDTKNTAGPSEGDPSTGSGARSAGSSSPTGAGRPIVNGT